MVTLAEMCYSLKLLLHSFPSLCKPFAYVVLVILGEIYTYLIKIIHNKMLMANWFNSLKEELFCSKDELMNCRKFLLYVMFKEDLRKCIIKKFQAYKKMEKTM